MMFREETVGSVSARHSATSTTGTRISASVNKVLVAVKAEKIISNTALAWALTHVVHSSDSITLLAVYSVEKSGRRFWNFSRLRGDCSSGIGAGKLPERISDISESCAQMVLQLHNQIEVRVKIKVVTGTPSGAVAAEARWSGSHWVILDKKLKQEVKHCMDELNCSVVVMNASKPKVLRLNLACSDELQTPFFSSASSPDIAIGKLKGRRLKHSTPVSSPEEPATSATRTIGVYSESSSDSMASLFQVYEQNPLYEGQGLHDKRAYKPINEPKEFNFDLEKDLGTHSTPYVSSDDNKDVFWIPQNRVIQRTKSPTSKTLLENFMHCDQEMKRTNNELGFKQSQSRVYASNLSNRGNATIPMGRTSCIPPPLCSQCQNKAPVFGKPPRQFSYKEIEEATDMFSNANFLAEGGFGVVHKGILRDGQVVAVKQLKFGGSQADLDFCREVRVLSCAQHRNVVLLIGFCVEANLRILVYEYICNGSLDLYLHGDGNTPLDWNSRLKIAIGAARGLRYLHEDCRVGCIVHRDFRPRNILLTHDFEPLVADFGLARWHSEWNINTEQDRVVGTSGYLAPEYLEAGNLTYKVDVYAFGIVLLELITGRRISELEQFNGHSFLSEWFHPIRMLEADHILQNVRSLNPYLGFETSLEFNFELQAMARAASLCLRLDPDARPPMSKILRVLEGGDAVRPIGLDFNSVGNRSGHLSGLSSHTPHKDSLGCLLVAIIGIGICLSMSVAMRNKPLEFGRPVKSKRKFKDLLLQKDNQFCADCNAPQPKWASANIGVFLCFKCYNVHRSLDTHISRVLSVGDEWSDDDIDAMIEVGGNSSANSIYEAYIPEGYAKPRPDSSQEERTKFIRSKYEYQEFLKPSLRIVSSKSSHQSSFSKHNADSFRSSYESSFSKRDAHSFRSSHEPSFSMRSADSFRSCHESSFSQCDADSFRSTTSLKNLERTREFIGKLQVKVIKGTNLAIRDMMTSDPYVVLKLGKQTVKTNVIKSNLNPVWNQVLLLSVPEAFGPLDLKVFDHDLFSADDIMGEAQVDLQPLIASAMAFGDAGMFDDMQIGKWLKSHDNALKHDSTVNIINGKVKQEISLKLQHVECGELDLELEWIPL